MLNEAAKATLVVAIAPDGELLVIKNTGGSRLRDDGIRALARRMHRRDRALLMRELIAAGEKPLVEYSKLTENDP
jgi:hypothetical protein